MRLKRVEIKELIEIFPNEVVISLFTIWIFNISNNVLFRLVVLGLDEEAMEKGFLAGDQEETW